MKGWKSECSSAGPATVRAGRVIDVAVPDLIRIVRIPGYRSDTIGRYEGGQFFAYVTGASREGFQGDADWRKLKLWYAVLHRFDRGGVHVESRIWSPGPGIRDGLKDLLEQWLAELPGHEYGDIAIRPFELIYDGIRFGLILESHGEYGDGTEELDWAELYPGRLGFSEPWDGGYDT